MPSYVHHSCQLSQPTVKKKIFHYKYIVILFKFAYFTSTQYNSHGDLNANATSIIKTLPPRLHSSRSTTLGNYSEKRRVRSSFHVFCAHVCHLVPSQRKMNHWKQRREKLPYCIVGNSAPAVKIELQFPPDSRIHFPSKFGARIDGQKLSTNKFQFCDGSQTVWRPAIKSLHPA